MPPKKLDSTSHKDQDVSPSKRQKMQKQQVQHPQQDVNMAEARPGPSSTVNIQSSETWEAVALHLRRCIAEPLLPAAAACPLRPGLQTVHDQLLQMMQGAVNTENGNVSVLVVGDHGVGKTLVVERAVSSLLAAQKQGNRGGVGVVRLHGLLHADERLCFQEIARQLCGAFEQKFSAAATFEENLSFVRGMLQRLYTCLASVVFVVDGWEHYCRKGRQQVLYYLLDALQDSKVSAAVIGISCAYDVMDRLEKRVKSRLSHRKLLVLPPARWENLDDPRDSQLGLLADMLLLPPQQPQQDPQQPSTSAATAATAELQPQWPHDVVAAHNSSVHDALKDKTVREAFRRLCENGASPHTVSVAADLALMQWCDTLASDPKPLSAASVLSGIQQVCRSYDAALAQQVAELPVLQLLLLVAAYRVCGRTNARMCNFEMAWDDYRAMQAGREELRFEKHTALRSWAELSSRGLTMALDQHAEVKGRALQYLGIQLRCMRDDIEEGIRTHPSCPDALLRYFRGEV